jgi:hypothetical protein
VDTDVLALDGALENEIHGVGVWAGAES